MRWGPWHKKKPEIEPAQARLPENETLRIIADHLTELSGEPWHVEENRVRGPGRTAVTLGDDHPAAEGHLDLVFVLDTERPDETSIPDCVTGHGDTTHEKIEIAAGIWSSTSAGALLELRDQKGTFADHYVAHDPDGFPGRHAIHGAIIGWGEGPEHEAAQQWALDHPLLPVIAPALTAAGLDRDRLVGVKIFFGSSDGRATAEVRVNGRACEPAADALLALDWPRPYPGSAYARTFAVLVHPGE
ncbi:DUF6348 family protein [Streptomyces polygonati]|uniref:DUF6348 family protein n=1 Tax=Streptomyces polygonati TaxID=1617087 RepID=A0ABV8HGK9_9ACTN